MTVASPGTSPAIFGAAIAAARAGDRHYARQLCARAIFDAQPAIARQPMLLRTALFALLVAHGFQLLSRLAMAVSGSEVEVSIRNVTGPAAPPRRQRVAGRELVSLDVRWLDQLTPDDLFPRHWAEDLIGGTHGRLNPVMPHEVEPV